MNKKLFGVLLSLASWGCIASPQAISAAMLDSVVRVECHLQYKGERVIGGRGTGFLIENGAYAITNSHVIDQCHPANKMTALEDFYGQLIDDSVSKTGKIPDSVIEIIVKHIGNDQEKVALFKADPVYRKKIIKAAQKVLAESLASKDFSNFSQSVSVWYLPKGSTTPTSVSVPEIIWASWFTDKKRNERGMDVAIIKISIPLTNKTSVTKFAYGNALEVSEEVFTVGFPAVADAAVDKDSEARYVPTVKKGIISKLGGTYVVEDDKARAKGVVGVPIIETDAAINSGNSGGPMFNTRGEVVGINTWGAVKGEGTFWAQDVEETLKVLHELNLNAVTGRDKPVSALSDNVPLLAGAGGVVLLAGFGIFWMRRRPGAVTAKTTSSPVGHGEPNAASPSGARRQVASVAEEKTTLQSAGAVEQTLVATARALSDCAIKSLTGEFAGTQIPLAADGVVLGRNASLADLVFSETKDISGKHCRIAFNLASGFYEVTDLGSTNGTFILPEGRKLSPNSVQTVAPGQHLRIGMTTEIVLI